MNGDFYKEKAPEEGKKRFISFYSGEEWYGIGMEKVAGVVSCPPITYVPGAPSHVLGIVNLRGNILSVTDLKRLFGSVPGKKSEEPPKENWLVVIEQGGIETGILVESKVFTTRIPPSKIDPPLLTLAAPYADYIEGESEVDGKLLGILKVEKLLRRN